jgi:DNA-binding transcriptional regulator YiaG
MASIPRLEELHRVLAFAIATHPSKLSGSEIRFLRKYLGWSGKDFATTIGVAAETVSRWENDKERIGLVPERLLRVMVFRLKPVEEYPTERLSQLGNHEGPVPVMGLQLDEGRWKHLKLAA